MAAERGHSMCKFLVAQALLRGVGETTIDLEKGIYWLKRAAESGLAEAEAELGLCYMFGKGMNQDYAAAIFWSRKAAEKGLAWAQCRLGCVPQFP